MNTSDMTVTITELPLDIQNQIPLSLRTYKNEYTLSQLPFDIQLLIEDYIQNKKEVNYDIILDCKPNTSKYGDLTIIDNVHDLVLEYLRNYFMITPNDYPFDSKFGSRLKYYLQTPDRSMQETLVTNEINTIANTVSSDLGVDVTIENINIGRSSQTGGDIEYNVSISVSINNSLYDLVLSMAGGDGNA